MREGRHDAKLAALPASTAGPSAHLAYELAPTTPPSCRWTNGCVDCRAARSPTRFTEWLPSDLLMRTYNALQGFGWLRDPGQHVVSSTSGLSVTRAYLHVSSCQEVSLSVISGLSFQDRNIPSTTSGCDQGLVSSCAFQSPSGQPTAAIQYGGVRAAMDATAPT